MTDETTVQSPKWLRVTVHVLVAWCAFWALFWGSLALCSLIPATHDLVDTPAMVMIGIMVLIGATGSFFVTRLEVGQLKSKSTRVFAVLGIVLLVLGWVLAPKPFTYVVF